MTFGELLALGIISPEQQQRFAQMLDERRSILIVGPTGSGKSLLMYVLLNEMSLRAPQDEFVLCEWHKEGPDFAPNVGRFDRQQNEELLPGGVPGFGHRRVAFDDFRDETAFRVLQSWAAFGGGVGTMYARSADAALETFSRVLGGRGADMVLEAIDVVVRMERARADVPKVAEIDTWGGHKKPSAPPEFKREWREQAALQLVPAEEAGRHVLHDTRRLMGRHLSGDEVVPFDSTIPIIHDHLRPDESFTAFAWSTLNTIMRGMVADGQIPDTRTAKHYAQLGVDSLLESVLTKWMLANHENRADWAGDLRSHMNLKDPRRIVGMVALYRSMTDKRTARDKAIEPDEVVDSLIATFQHPKEHYATMIQGLEPILEMVGSDVLEKMLSAASLSGGSGASRTE